MKLLKDFVSWLFVKFGHKCIVCGSPTTKFDSVCANDRCIDYIHDVQAIEELEKLAELEDYDSLEDYNDNEDN